MNFEFDPRLLAGLANGTAREKVEAGERLTPQECESALNLNSLVGIQAVQEYDLSLAFMAAHQVNLLEEMAEYYGYTCSIDPESVMYTVTEGERE